MKRIIQVLLLAVMAFLAYMVVQSVIDPIEFKKEKDKRYEAVIQNLKDIRTAQLAYKEVNGKFTGSFDTLTTFVQHDSLPIIFKKGVIPEEMLGKITEQEAIKKGIIVRDTIQVSVKDSLFPANYPIDSLRFIPYSEDKEFRMGTNTIKTGSGLVVNVFEARAPSKEILVGLDKQEIINLNDGLEYKGLKVGSLTESNNSAGNWE